MIEIKEISPAVAKELAEAGALFIDVREKVELEEQAYIVPNILHIPYSAFDERYQDIPKDKNLIFACRSGARSLRVAQFLVIQGWDAENIFNLEGGILAWTMDRLPTKLGQRSFTMAKPSSSCGCGSGSPDSCC
ncbi:MAG: rhodanese-like domain-containing protein [Paludibacter sp.]|nr:rhodanese-like domain-containing protein [Paludibacter sp.]